MIGQLTTILISYWFRLYWTDTGTNTISSVDLSGDLATMVTLVTDNVEEPRAIVLHPEQGSVVIVVNRILLFIETCFEYTPMDNTARWIFWSDWGRYPRIERAGLDGSHREVLHETGVGWPNGLTLDLVMDRSVELSSFYVHQYLKKVPSSAFSI